jgi:hypothetical protein
MTLALYQMSLMTNRSMGDQWLVPKLRMVDGHEAASPPELRRLLDRNSGSAIAISAY